MRIISKFRDCYDNISKYYSDRVWIRETLAAELPLWSSYYKHEHDKIPPLSREDNTPVPHNLSNEQQKFLNEIFAYAPRGKRDSEYRTVIGYCGRIFCGIVHNKKIHPGVEKVQIYLSDKEWEESLRDDKEHSFKRRREYLFNSGKSIDEWNNSYSSNLFITGRDNIFVTLNAPIFIMSAYKFNSPHLIVNPCLRDYALHTHIDVVTLYQDITGYVGNVLTNREDCNIVMSQEDKRDSKGFDKFSFKKEKEKK